MKCLLCGKENDDYEDLRLFCNNDCEEKYMKYVRGVHYGTD